MSHGPVGPTRKPDWERITREEREYVVGRNNERQAILDPGAESRFAWSGRVTRSPSPRHAQTPGPPMPTTASAQPVDEVAPEHLTASEAVARHEEFLYNLPLPTRPTREDELVCKTCGTVTELGAWCTRCGGYNCILNNEQCIVTHQQQCQGLHSDDDTEVDTDKHLSLIHI